MPNLSDDENWEVLIGNSNKRFSGVTSTMLQTLKHQKHLVKLRVLGPHHLDDSKLNITFLRAAKACRQTLANGKWRVFHARRNDEMIQALLLKYLFRAKIKICFTSTAQRRHTWLTRWLMRRMDGIITTSERANCYLARKADVIIPHGIDHNTYSPSSDRQASWRALGLPGRYGIGVFGRVRQQKGIDIFVDACIEQLAKHEDVCAIIVGAIKEEDRSFVAQMKARITEAKLGHRIVFLGEQKFSELPELFRSLHLVCALSRNEGFGLTVLEAMSSGVAVLASDAGAWREIIRENLDGRVVGTGDVAATSQALDEMLSKPDRLVEMGNCGRQRILQHYTIEMEAERLVRFYKTLQDNSPRRIK